MLLHVSKKINKLLENGLYIVVMLVLIPAVFYFETCIVLPYFHKAWTLPYIFHISCATFLLQNIVGNLIFGSCIDTSIKRQLLVTNSNENSNWTFCSVCECLRPPRAWHCRDCDTCILKRDHHCMFFVNCVGYFNHRHFILLLFYVFLSALYSSYYNIIFVSQYVSWDQGLGFILLKLILPLVSLVVDFSRECTYIFVVDLFILIGANTGLLFLHNFNNILKGKTLFEVNHNTKNFSHENIVLNLKDVFGTRWYLTWISPFIRSSLPGNGIDWCMESKQL